MSEREITGRQVFFVTAGAFTVIIAVNIAMAVSAVATFPGLEVKNSYVASQTFDEDRAAQEALGWTARARVEAGELILDLRDTDGAAVVPDDIDAVIGRATHVADDIAPRFRFDGEVHRARVELSPGYWALRLAIPAEDGTLFRQRLQLHVDDPA